MLEHSLEPKVETETVPSTDQPRAESGPSLVDPEVRPKGKRRILTAAYKARILRRFDACSSPGERGALLRGEGLYFTQLSDWRRKRDAGLLPQKRGRKADPGAACELAKLQRENERLAEKLRHAELIIEAQKKMADLFGVLTAPSEMK